MLRRAELSAHPMTSRLALRNLWPSWSATSFWRRVILMPARPNLQAERRLGEVLLPLVVLALVLCGALSGFSGLADPSRRRPAALLRHDASGRGPSRSGCALSGDEVIQFLEEGWDLPRRSKRDRLPRIDHDTTSWLASAEILRKRGLKTEVYRFLNPLQLPPDPLRIDGTSLAPSTPGGASCLYAGVALLLSAARESLGARSRTR